MNARLICAGLLSLAVAFSSCAAAHGMWIEQRRGILEVIYGHGAEDDAYDAAKLKTASAFDETGKEMPAVIERLSDHGRIDAGEQPAVVVVTLDNGYWTRDAQGNWHNAGKSAVEGAEESGYYTKSAVSVHRSGVELPDLSKLDMVIVPLTDPLAVHPGEYLAVTVLVDGKPAKNIELIGDYVNDPETTVATTDAQGKAKLRVRNAGLNVIAASASLPNDDPEADVRGMFSTLAFVASTHQH